MLQSLRLVADSGGSPSGATTHLLVPRARATLPRRMVRVAVVEADPALRHVLDGPVSDHAGFARAGRYRTLDQARRGLPCSPADVLLVDLSRSPTPVAPGIRAIRSASPATAVIALVSSPRAPHVFDSLCGGAVGCLLTPLDPGRLAIAIEDAADGGSPLSPEIARTVVDLFQRTGPPTSGVASLTPRERTVLSLLARGATYDQAAGEIGVTVNTVRNYVRSIYEKLQVHSKGAAVARAFRQGLI